MTACRGISAMVVDSCCTDSIPVQTSSVEFGTMARGSVRASSLFRC